MRRQRQEEETSERKRKKLEEREATTAAAATTAEQKRKEEEAKALTVQQAAAEKERLRLNEERVEELEKKERMAHEKWIEEREHALVDAGEHPLRHDEPSMIHRVV